jgi:hypothetical protein
MNDVVIVRADDWDGLFVNGILANSGHSIEISDLKPHLPIKSIETKWLNDMGISWLEKFGDFKDSELSKIPKRFFEKT